MKVKASDVLSVLLPWDLVVEIGGVEYPTRQPSVGELAMLQAIGDMPQPAALELLRGLFTDAGERTNGWAVDEMNFAIAAYMAYFRDRAKKNSEAIVTETMKAMAAAIVAAEVSTSGNSSRP